MVPKLISLALLGNIIALRKGDERCFRPWEKHCSENPVTLALSCDVDLQD